MAGLWLKDAESVYVGKHINPNIGVEVAYRVGIGLAL